MRLPLITVLLVLIFIGCVATLEEGRKMTSTVPGGKDRDVQTDSTSDVSGLDTHIVRGEQPLIRVGLLEGYEYVDFRVKGVFSIQSLEGEEIFTNIESDRRWRCRIDKSIPAQFVYSILLGKFDSEAAAEKVASPLRKRGEPVRLLPLGRKIVIHDEIIHEGTQWRVIVGAFENEDQARPYLRSFEADDSLHPKILRHRVEDPNGVIELYDSEYDLSAMIENGYRIIPASPETEITVYKIKVGVGFHWETIEDRVYRGIIEVRVDNSSKLLALNELVLDEYLKGVIPSEMHKTYPAEALKAQAVAARSYTIAKLASRSANDPVDFPATVAFQVYSGMTRENEATNTAVEETAGEVLKVGNRVCETYFHSNSGGHTESKEFWNPPAEAYLTGSPVIDPKKVKDFDYDLSREKDAIKWIRSHPDNFSNPRGTQIDMLDRNARYFRWEVTYTHRELEDIIQKKLGFDIGTLIDIQPLQRGVSGRIIELEILGTHRNHKIFGELNIRRALSESALNSSCFMVKNVMGNLGHPVEITFVGAGFGHGVGMDQTAAGVMATEGWKYKDILSFFYKDSQLDKLW